MSDILFENLLSETRDGDWGREEPGPTSRPYRVIRGTDFPRVKYGNIREVPMRYLSAGSIERRTLRLDDIIIETAGGSQGRPTGRTLLITNRIVTDSDYPITCASFCRFLRVDPNVAYPQYVYWFLQNMYEQGDMWSHQVQHTGLARFQYTVFAKSVVVFLPPLPQQRSIARVLGSLDDKIELNRRMNETTESIARALFQTWFVDFDPVRARMEGCQPLGMDAETSALFPSKFVDSALGRIPEGWRVGSLRELCNRVENGGTPSRKVDAYWNPPTVSWLTSGEVRQGIIVASENAISTEGLTNSSAKLWPPGTTVVAMYGATAGQVCWLAIETAANQACCGLIPQKDMACYLYFATSREISNLEQQARGSAQQNLSQDIVASHRILLPPNSILTAFERATGCLLQMAVQKLNENNLLANVRDALLPKLMSGEIRVRDAEKLVEDTVAL